MKKAYTAAQQKLRKNDYLPLVKLALREDHAHNDITSLAVFSKMHTGMASVVVKQNSIIAGLQVAVAAFETFDGELKIELHCQDGDMLTAGQKVLTVKGKTLSILAAERVALNFLALLSGLAQRAYNAVELAKKYNITILDTRKTLPAYRRLSKYAMFVGGVVNHRAHLADMGLLKDNHIAQAESITNAIKKFRQQYPKKKLEVEVETLSQLEEVLQAPADMILLDNMSVSEMSKATSLVRNYNQKNKAAITCEASGGITLENFFALQNAHVDYASMGELTSKIIPIDFSLDMQPK